MNERRRNEILARYRAHARQFEELAGNRAPRPTRARTVPIAEVGDPLTPRQVEVLQLITDGLSNQEISKQLVLSEETVKTHVRQVFAKLGAATRAHAVALGLRAKLVT